MLVLGCRLETRQGARASYTLGRTKARIPLLLRKPRNARSIASKHLYKCGNFWTSTLVFGVVSGALESEWMKPPRWQELKVQRRHFIIMLVQLNECGERKEAYPEMCSLSGKPANLAVEL